MYKEYIITNRTIHPIYSYGITNFSSCQETFPELDILVLRGKKFLIFHLLEYFQNGERGESSKKKKITPTFLMWFLLAPRTYSNNSAISDQFSN